MSPNKILICLAMALWLTVGGSFVFAQATSTGPYGSPDFLDWLTKSNQEALSRQEEQVAAEQVSDDAASRCASSYRTRVPGAPGVGGDITYVEDKALIWYTGAIGKLVDGNTGQTSQYTQMICRHVFSLRRMQQDMENRIFVENKSAAQQGAEAIERQKKEVSEAVLTGRDSDGDGVGDSSFIPANISDHYYNKDREVIAIFQEDIANSGNLFKGTVGTVIEFDTNSSLQGALTSTISEQEYNDFVYNPRKLDSATYNRIAREYYKPQNNPVGSVILAYNQLNIRRNVAKQQEELEIQRNQGFLDNKKCAELTGKPGDTNRVCRRWETVQPGSTIRDHYTALLNARLARAVNADDANDVIPSLLPSLPEILDPNNIGKYGYPKDNNNNDSITDDVDDFDGDGLINSEDPDKDNDGVPGDRDADDFNPSVRRGGIGGPKITMAITKAADGKSAELSWSAEGATECTADNAWVTAAGDKYPQEVNFITLGGEIVTKGTELNTSGRATINLPLDFEMRIQRKRAGTVTDIIGTNTRSGGLQQMILSLTDVQAGDTFNFGIKPYGKPNFETDFYPPNEASPEAVIALWKALVEQVIVDPNNMTNKYAWEFEPTAIKAKTEGKYAIRCASSGGQESTKTVSLTP